jgi:phosphoglycolate phosphatase
MSRFDSVLFDLDGTLTDARIAIMTSMAHALAELGVTPPPIDELIWCIGPPIRQNFARLLGSDRAHLVEAAVEIYYRRYEREGVRETFAYPGIDAMLRQLSGRGSSIYLATSKFVDHAEHVLDAFSLRPYFTEVFGSGRDGALADKSELMRFILKEVGSSKDRAVMIGDREHDIIGGKANGVYTIGVTYGYGSRVELERAGADAIFASPDKILALIL